MLRRLKSASSLIIAPRRRFLYSWLYFATAVTDGPTPRTRASVSLTTRAASCSARRAQVLPAVGAHKVVVVVVLLQHGE